MKLAETSRPVGARLTCHHILRKWRRLGRVLVAVYLISACGPAFAATFTVKNINNAGPDSLRQAISSANTNPGLDTIVFNISGPPPPYTIQVAVQALPTITDPVIIDGTTQPGFAGLPIIELNGGQIAGGPGLQIQAGGSTVRGLVINGFRGGGILIVGNGGNVIERNFIGTDTSGTIGLGNSATAGHIVIDNSSGNVVGGTSPTSRNLISGNDFVGVHIRGDTAISNRVQGNFIGTDLTGSIALNNPGVGVFIEQAIGSLVGGTGGNARNLISGNSFAGIFLSGGPGSVIQGNFIGTDISGTNPLGNGRGILLQNFAGNSLIGGIAAGAGNLIAFNGGGVLLEPSAGSGNAILGNSIFMNDAGGQGFGLGIDLNIDAVTFNDFGDTDSGPNNLQNFPDLTQATSSGNNTMVMGSLQSEPNSTYRLEFFSNPQCNPIGFGEGKNFLGARIVMTDAAGDAPFTFSFPIGVPFGSFITATATDSGNNTSEFSPCTFVQPGAPPSDISVAVDVSPPGPPVGMAMTYAVTLTGLGQSVLTGVRVTNQLPASVTFISATPSQGTCMESNGVVTCDIGDFPPSSTPTVQIKVVPNTVGNNTNKTSVGGSGPDSDPSNNSVVTVTTIYLAGPPVITKHPDSQIVPRDSNVILRVSAGPSPLTYQWRRNGVNLPDETNDTLRLTKFNPLDGGSYTVVVGNDLDAIQSLPAILQTDNPPLAPSDDFKDANLLFGSSGMGGGDNIGATSQPGEPKHVGKSGGRSVWFDWVAPQNGIVTFSTAGSTFDTLLAAYTGPSVDALIEVAGDEDSGNFLNSTISFNVVAGTLYHLVIDGYAKQEGTFLLSWQLEVRTSRQPEILVHPASQAVGLNQPAELTVTTAIQAGVTLQYQWFFNGQPIAGADKERLMIPSVDPNTVGSYFVRITGNNRSVDSREAFLQVNQTDGVPDPVLATGKFRDVADSVGSGALRSKSRRTKAVAHGFSGTQIFSSVGSTTEPGEPIHCGVIGGASYWFAYQPPTNGIATISTEGSSYNTVLAIYTGPGDDYSTLVSVACDNNSGADGLDSKTSFPATGGTIYWIAVDGVGGVTGTVVLNWNLVQPPQIVTPPTSLVVTNGSNATFTVIASGSALAYQWRFNGGNLLNQTNFSLTISNAAPGNEGNYTVVITNTVGSITSAVATLTVLVPPSMSSQPSSLVVTNGNNATFSVTATGTTPFAYQWRFNGSNLSGEAGPSLTILSAAPGNAGNYTVVVNNSAGSVTSVVATLTVLVPPAITSQPSSLTVTNGSNATFSVTATGTATLAYQWRFNGLNLSGETGSTLTILNATPGNEGNYTVIVTNTAGSVTSIVATLTVLVPPSISSQPSSLTVTNGSNAAFSVTATGTAPFAYQWRFNGGDLSGETGFSLTILNATTGNAGNYTVVVSTSAGSVTSAVATLTVLVPPAITSQPLSLTVTNGSNATFSVTATGTATLAYQWRFNGLNLSGETGSTLTILNAAPGNEGNYTVVVTNTAGSVTSVVATLTVLVPPAITSQPASRIVTNGSTVTFTVTAAGTPTPGYQWRFNDSNISGANSASLVLNNVQYTNTGNYVVAVSNSAGAVTSAVAVLTVLLPLELRWTTSTLSGVRFTVAGSSNVNFTIEASTNFVSWEQLLTTNSSTGLYEFTDTNSLILPLRFYRALHELP